MSNANISPAQADAERRVLELFLNVSRATRVTSARDLDFTEALIRRERQLQAELAALGQPPPATLAKAA